ncbi:MAG: sugar phosphate isomerase/epimerase [Desulfobacteraceae bacterium]|nr:MAG: sugar phosphate isomerase/epimerase [Desulfobacteraceae bacterium]
MTTQSHRAFKLGTTSFIYPDHIVPNVERLGAHFEEIELLIFESMPDDALPPEQDIQKLVSLSQALDVGYNVHLPLDVSLTNPDPQQRIHARERIVQVMNLTRPLNASTHTLHLDYNGPASGPEDVRAWQKRAAHSLDALFKEGIDPRQISVETLNFPFEFVDPLIREFDLQVCLDMGHILKYGYDLERTFDAHRERISVIHLHGVDMNGTYFKDHLSLDRLPDEVLLRVIALLEKYSGVVSIEVFNLGNLERSLTVLNTHFEGLGSFVHK